jgi:hypothetical protein
MIGHCYCAAAVVGCRRAERPAPISATIAIAEWVSDHPHVFRVGGNELLADTSGR